MANELSYGIGRITGSPDPVDSTAVLSKATPNHAVPVVSGNTLTYDAVVFPTTTALDQYVWFELPTGGTLTSAQASDGSFGFGQTEWVRIGSSQVYVYGRRLLVGTIVRMNFMAQSSASPSPTNHRPRVSTSIGNYRFTVGNPHTFNLDNYFTDPDGDTLTYHAVSSSTGLATVHVAGNMLTVTPVFQGGPVTITVTATDPRGETVSDTFAVDVIGTSTGVRPPRAVGTIPDVSVDVNDDGATSVAGYFSDPDSNIQAWSAVSSDPSKVSIVSASHGIISYHGVAAGDATITVYAHYNSNRVSQTFRVTAVSAEHVVTHQPVVLSPIVIPNLVPGETFTLNNIGTHFEDLDGTTPSLHLVGDYNRDTATISLQPGTNNLTIKANQVGLTEVKIVARDASGASVQTQFFVEVEKATSTHPTTDVLDFLGERWLTIDEFIVYVGGVERDGDDLDDENREIVDDQRREYGLYYTAAKRDIETFSPDAPFESKNAALVRYGGYMYQKGLAPEAGEFAERNFFVFSGAQRELETYRQYKITTASPDTIVGL